MFTFLLLTFLLVGLFALFAFLGLLPRISFTLFIGGFALTGFTILTFLLLLLLLFHLLEQRTVGHCVFHVRLNSERFIISLDGCFVFPQVSQGIAAVVVSIGCIQL